MSETRVSPSSLPVLVMVVLAIVSLVQFFFPALIPPGLTLAIMGIIFLILYALGWVRDAIILIVGWLLAGFGSSAWLAEYPLFKQDKVDLPLILFGLGLAFAAIYLTSTRDSVLEAQGKQWPLVPAAVLGLVAGILILEITVGREKLWGVVIPLTPAVSAIWYLRDWRRRVETAGPE